MLLTALSAVVTVSSMLPLEAESSCSSPANTIEAENCLPGTPQSTWDIPTKDAGDPSIQGFATNISVNQGNPVFFKVNTPATAWRLDIYRMGYYGGNGARLVASVKPSVTLPQSQPSCLYDSTTGLTDCGNWAVSASWTVPANATSGIYFAKAIRTDTGGTSHIMFVVRNDASHSDVLFQTSDTTWQAYNNYGGQDFYTGPFCSGSYCRAYKVSYNRPYLTRSVEPQTWVFNAEYPMVRWLEANGYDVSYFTGTDADRNGSLILNHKVWMSNGHDEYWSGNQRANVESARAAGVHLAFFSGNTTYWKTRWENSIDGSGTPNRTLVCYKETWANSVIDPADPPTWTGTWRDPRYSPPADGGQPENALAGALTRFADSYLGGPIAVPQADGKMRFWRNTSIATLLSGQTASLAPGTLADELDMDEDNGFRPPGLFHLTTTPVSTSSACLLDYGNTVGACSTVHNVTMYRHPGGSLVFSTGTYEWAWGLDANHDHSNLGSTTDVRMKQATVNLFADMGVQPATLQSGLTAAAASTDLTPPTSTIMSPIPGASLAIGTTVMITGTATDSGGGVVAGVEVSTDGGATWHAAAGRGSWSYAWTPSVAGNVAILSRGVDDSGNLETPSSGANVLVSGATFYTIWPGTTVPGIADSGPDSAVELGVKFRADVNGTVTGVRFYKAGTNTGTHVGNLWTSSGTLLATAIFTNETASGWQHVSFSAPVAITANTVYVASYHTSTGHYSDDQNYFVGNGVDNPPLHALTNGVSGFDGVYAYGSASSFPSQGFNSSNYWVDVAFTSTSAPILSAIAVTPGNPTISTGATQQFSATGTYSDGSTQNITNQAAWTSSNTAVVTINSVGLATAVGAGSTTISAALSGITGSTNVTAVATVQTGYSIWSGSTVPGTADSGPDSAVELGVKFSADSNGTITGIRFYKASTNTGTHVGNLWTSGGTLLATGTFSSETASGWQQVTFATPVTISANTVYVASYHTSTGHYSDDQNYFTGKGIDSPPLHAPADGVSGFNGVFVYGSASGFPNQGWNESNYWVDVVFSTTVVPPPTLSSITVTPAGTTISVGATQQFIATGSYSDGSTQNISGQTAWASSSTNTATINSSGLATSVNPGSTTISATLNGVSGSTTLTVQSAPVTITTASLPNGKLNVSYSATLAASGGTPPYTWVITSGALPTGLKLNNSTGVISGTPTARGTFGFSVQATDSGNPAKTASRSLSIRIR